MLFLWTIVMSIWKLLILKYFLFHRTKCEYIFLNDTLSVIKVQKLSLFKVIICKLWVLMWGTNIDPLDTKVYFLKRYRLSDNFCTFFFFIDSGSSKYWSELKSNNCTWTHACSFSSFANQLHPLGFISFRSNGLKKVVSPKWETLSSPFLMCILH